jgi:UDP-N-acetylglucosamine 1-carboxyvinyltransferase
MTPPDTGAVAPKAIDHPRVADPLPRMSGMDRIRIRGGNRLAGTLPISGAKNAALPLMAAALLTDKTLTLTNLPYLADITSMSNLLLQHGLSISVNGDGGIRNGRTIELTAARITDTTAPYDLVRKMRASILVLGPLLARAGEAQVSLPGGCAIGTRPVDLHLKGLEHLGAEIELDAGYIRARAPKGLRGGQVVFPFVSVGATENLLMAATLAKGETQLVNAAREPEIVDLANCLIAMGAKIDGIGSDKITIQGVDRLGAASHRIVADRIETGTYAVAAAITGGDIELLDTELGLIEALAEVLDAGGISVKATERGVRVSCPNGRVRGVDVMTEPFPGFPTDLQAQIMALMTTADGAAMITETIFENRFMHVPELMRMGASINVHGASAMVRGVNRLNGAPVMATDLRASVSLVLAGLAAEGETIVNRVYHLDRGYERLEEKLAACGADVERLKSR